MAASGTLVFPPGRVTTNPLNSGWATTRAEQLERAAEALDAVLAPLQLSASALKAKERYAEDVF